MQHCWQFDYQTTISSPVYTVVCVGLWPSPIIYNPIEPLLIQICGLDPFIQCGLLKLKHLDVYMIHRHQNEFLRVRAHYRWMVRVIFTLDRCWMGSHLKTHHTPVMAYVIAIISCAYISMPDTWELRGLWHCSSALQTVNNWVKLWVRMRERGGENSTLSVRT